jgi:hypothetical protein
MLKVGSVSWKGRCSKHPTYSPEQDGLGGIRGGCQRCQMLLEIWTHHSKMLRLMREFGTRLDNRHRREEAENDRQMSLLDGGSVQA